MESDEPPPIHHKNIKIIVLHQPQPLKMLLYFSFCIINRSLAIDQNGRMNKERWQTLRHVTEKYHACHHGILYAAFYCKISHTDERNANPSLLTTHLHFRSSPEWRHAPLLQDTFENLHEHCTDAKRYTLMPLSMPICNSGTATTKKYQPIAKLAAA